MLLTVRKSSFDHILRTKSFQSDFEEYLKKKKKILKTLSTSKPVKSLVDVRAIKVESTSKKLREHTLNVAQL